MKRRIAFLFAIVSLTFAAGCGYKQEAATQQPSVLPPDAKVEKVSSSPIDDYYEAVGTTRAATASIISTRIMGSIVKLPVREGDFVRAGQLLVEIDNRDLTTQLRKAQAGLRETQQAIEEVDRSITAAQMAKNGADAQRQLASKTFERYSTLLERRSVSPHEFDEVQARFRVADAEAERSQKMLESLLARKNQILARVDQASADAAGAQIYASYARITSPISGVVTARQIDVGQMAMPGMPLLTIEADSHYRLEAAVEESHSINLRIGQPVMAIIDAFGDREFEGQIVEIIPASDPASRSVTVKIALPADSSKIGLRSGMFGKARFLIGQRQALTVASSSIVERGQITGVYVVDSSGTGRLRIIRLGKSYGDRVEVLSGLTEGELIVIDRIDRIVDGAKVD